MLGLRCPINAIGGAMLLEGGAGPTSLYNGNCRFTRLRLTGTETMGGRFEA